jgi:hypothetical protein
LGNDEPEGGEPRSRAAYLGHRGFAFNRGGPRERRSHDSRRQVLSGSAEIAEPQRARRHNHDRAFFASVLPLPGYEPSLQKAHAEGERESASRNDADADEDDVGR